MSRHSSIPNDLCSECQEVPAQVADGYRKPIRAIQEALDRPKLPQVSISPSHEHMMFLRTCRNPPIAELARPRLCLAGLRIDPANHGEFGTGRFTSLTIKRISDAAELHVLLPHDARLGRPQWSPDGKRFAFINVTPDGIELWTGDIATAKVHRIEDLKLNAVLGAPFQWMPDNRSLLVRLVSSRQDTRPIRSIASHGPHVLEADGAASCRTYANRLRDSHDEDLFDYYATSQLATVDVLSGKVTPFGEPAIFSLVDPSPDGRHFIVVRVERPYSRINPWSTFPRVIEIWNRSAQAIFKLGSRAIGDTVPRDGVPSGPRECRWLPTEPATVVWIEALDGGDPKNPVTHRDRVLALRAPYKGSPLELIKTNHRFSSLRWAADQTFALIEDYDVESRWRNTYIIRLEGIRAWRSELIWSLNIQDRYSSPGVPLSRLLPSGHAVLIQSEDWIYFSGDGATPDGDCPFLNRFNVRTLETEQLFRSNGEAHESVVALFDSKATRLLTCRESPTESPNYFLRERNFNSTNVHSDKKPRAKRKFCRSYKSKSLTHFNESWHFAQQIQKERVSYLREDGVQLSMMLHLPPGYRSGQRLPTLLWSYPYDYSNKDLAEQVRSSTNRFTNPRALHLLMLVAGYAILDDASMPIIGECGRANDTFAPQLAMNARAAIDKAVSLGVSDANRIAIGGHSYGATMAAMLLAHTDLFQAGIAMSGAYNRTLTPFGFQAERRTLWEAPQVYAQMSPLMSADRIKVPLLLIHGEEDENPGTLPIQSERMYHAIRGNGGVSRLVMLPHEGHCYSGRESIEHVLWEITDWLGRYV